MIIKLLTVDIFPSMNKMGVVEFCEVKFLNNPNKVFHSGQALTGVVEIDLKKTLKVRSE